MKLYRLKLLFIVLGLFILFWSQVIATGSCILKFG